MSVRSVTVRQLQDSIEAHRNLLASATRRADGAQQQLIRIGLEFCSGQFDQLQKSGTLLEQASPETLGTLIISTLKSNLSAQSLQEVNWPERLGELSKKIEALQKEVDMQTQRANLAEDRVLRLEKQASSLDQSLAHERKKRQDLPTMKSPEPAAGHYEEWFELWTKKKGFERDKQIVLLIGQTGYSRLSEIQQSLVQKGILGERTAYRGIQACHEEELIERRGGVSVQGRPTDLVLLTDKGKWVYTKLSGESPAPGEYEALLKAHKSNRHTTMILKTADYLSALGFEVEREPLQIKLGENRYSQPDLVARKNGEVFYIEVESGERPDRASQLHKWENAYLAGAGRICVVTPRLGVMNTIQGKIVQWATENGKKPELYLTHLNALKSCQPGDNPWVRMR